ncbi:MAG TPA: hypothetical protein DHW61_17485, partial [Lachnoclostridium phytofermentans]|nr:hypothetical protein [Lachnoclostridium phytofermentans]
MKKNGSVVLKFAYEYDGAGNRTLEEIWQEKKHYRREYTYYKNNTVKSMSETGDNNVTYSYVYDAAGNISEKHVTKIEDGKETTKVTRYTYDSANRMLSLSEGGGDTRAFRYDANGNRIARILNGKGNVSSSEVDTSKNSKENADYYYYDYEDRLVEIVIHNGKVFTYGYDGEGNRLWRTYSQHPVVKSPVSEGDRVTNPPSFPENNKDNTEVDTTDIEDKSIKSDIELESASEIDEIESDDNSLVSLMNIQDDAELITAVDSYLLSSDNVAFAAMKGNNGNGNGN